MVCVCVHVRTCVRTCVFACKKVWFGFNPVTFARCFCCCCRYILCKGVLQNGLARSVLRRPCCHQTSCAVWYRSTRILTACHQQYAHYSAPARFHPSLPTSLAPLAAAVGHRDDETHRNRFRAGMRAEMRWINTIQSPAPHIMTAYGSCDDSEVS